VCLCLILSYVVKTARPIHMQVCVYISVANTVRPVRQSVVKGARVWVCVCPLATW